jgi:copper resistance protein D
MTTEFFVLTRTVHIGGCLLLFGFFAFDRFVVVSVCPEEQAEILRFWRTRLRQLSLLLLPAILLSGMAWFAFVAMTMSGLPLREAIEPETARAVWSQTQFGTVWQIRSVLWLACIAVVTVPGFVQDRTSLSKRLFWLEFILSGLLLGSLTWAGHGQEGQPARWHASADVLHLLVAGFWPAGLLPLALLLREMRRHRDSGHSSLMAALVSRFSAMSLVSVAILALTGFVNSWFLVGSFSNLLQQPYGKWLVAKIILFLLTVAIGAVNLLRLKPRLLANATQGNDAEPTLAQLQRNIFLELLLSTAVIVIVGILGILPPAAH